ncbi:MAG: dephospho-CoA kinase [Sodalis sp. (in: enterobacteria)]
MTQYIVALTGGIGSGKSTVAKIFAAFGVPLVDADIIARNLIQSDVRILHTIIQHFGKIVLRSDGTLDRAALRFRIFGDPKEKAWLDDFLHPLIQRQTQEQLRAFRAPYGLWVVPLLIENHLQRHAHRVLLVDVDRGVQITRTIIRDGVSREHVENILAVQISRQRRLTCADDIIENNGHQDEMIDHIATLHQRYLLLSRQQSERKKSHK